MAETVLMRADLTPAMIAGGRALLTGLDELGVSIDAALWLLDEEIAEWRLILASRLVRTDGPRILYRKVNRLLTKLRLQDVIWIDMVAIVDPHTRIVEALVGALGMTESVDGARLDNATIGGVRIPGCLLYRLAVKPKTKSRAIKAAAAE